MARRSANVAACSVSPRRMSPSRLGSGDGSSSSSSTESLERRSSTRCESPRCSASRSNWCRASVVELDVYLGSRLAGRVTGEQDQVKFEYARERIDREGVDIARVLPLQPEPLPPGPTPAFCGGLLPEASLREVLARDWGVDPLDTWALLAAIGRESAGAITILPAGDPMPSKGGIEWLTEEELAEAIRRL